MSPDECDGFHGYYVGDYVGCEPNPCVGADVIEGEQGAETAGMSLTFEPNPIRASASVTIEARDGQAGATKLEIYDASGRVVRTLGIGRGSDVLSWTWDGRNQDGEPVPAGVYFLRVFGGGRQAMSRAVVVG
jgi:flagellar hook assembly protein FlgD